MKFLVFNFDYHWYHGGVVVTHEFTKILSDLGEEVYMMHANIKSPEDKTTVVDYETAAKLALEDDCVTIYPEIVRGNPMNAKHVVRWMLYYPEFTESINPNFKEELIFVYLKRFVENTPYRDSPTLTVIKTRIGEFYPINIDRTHDAILIKKSAVENTYHDLRNRHYEPFSKMFDKDVLLFDTTIQTITNKSVQDLNYELNKIRYFISFDRASYFNVLAALSGCVSVQIPIDGLSKEEWRETTKHTRHGVAYGLGDIDWALQTRDLLIEDLQESEKTNITEVEKFINIVKQHWNL